MRYLTHSIIVGLMGALMSCSGEQGEAGPPGTAGTTGVDGKAGDPGVAGAPALTKVSDAPADKCADGGKMAQLLEDLENHDDVKDVYANADVEDRD